MHQFVEKIREDLEEIPLPKQRYVIEKEGIFFSLWADSKKEAKEILEKELKKWGLPK